MPSAHRKQVKHYDLPGHVHELTFSCYRRLQLLGCDSRRAELCKAIDAAISRHQFRLLAFVLMPEHVHLLVQPTANGSAVSDLLRSIKRPFSYRIKKQLFENDDSLIRKLTVRQRPGVTTFRFWQERPGYDRNIVESRTLVAAVDYIHMNPVRRRLCDRAVDWRWSSARRYLEPESAADPALPKINLLTHEHLE